VSELQKVRNRRRLVELEAEQSNTSSHLRMSPTASAASAAGTTASAAVDMTEEGDRCFLCFVADAHPFWPHHLDQQKSMSSKLSNQIGDRDTAVSGAPYLVRLALWAANQEQVAECWGVSHQQRGMLGTVVYDTFGYHIPSRFQEGSWYRRRNIGYISNLAVAPGARRCDNLLQILVYISL
jgi:hypothetical protein